MALRDRIHRLFFSHIRQASMASQPDTQPTADDGLSNTQPPQTNRYSPPPPSYHSRAPSVLPNDIEVHSNRESDSNEIFPHSHLSIGSPASSETSADIAKSRNSLQAVITRDAVGRDKYDPPQPLRPIEPSSERPHQLSTVAERQDPKARKPPSLRSAVCAMIILLAILVPLKVTGTFDAQERQSDEALEEIVSSIFPSYTTTPLRTQTFVDWSSAETITVVWNA